MKLSFTCHQGVHGKTEDPGNPRGRRNGNELRCLTLSAILAPVAEEHNGPITCVITSIYLRLHSSRSCFVKYPNFELLQVQNSNMVDRGGVVELV
jgi:hypothetical protein